MRTLWPLRELDKRKDWYCRYFSMNDMQRMMIEAGDPRIIEGYDLYVFSRVYAPGDCPLEKEKERGAKIIFEMDDDLTDQYRDLGYGKWVTSTVDFCDAITCSTLPLGKLAEKFYGKPTFVLPNHIDTDFFTRISSQAERLFAKKLVIGLCGTRTHWADWMEVQDALIKVKETYPDVVIVCGGYQPAYLKKLGTTFIAPMVYDAYPAMLRQFDIRLCPLEPDNLFNDSKSPISALEAMAAARPVGQQVGGCVPVCSDHAVFRGTVQHMHNGVLVKPGMWFRTLERLIQDWRLTNKLAVQGHKWVKKYRDISQGAQLWAKAYKEVING